ncbi:MAG: hypothetical protein ABSD64_03205 [Terriglobales bacterium]
MDRSTRMHFIGKVTYYIGWLALLCGGLAHTNIAANFFMAMHLPQRNLLEICVVSFVICIASELRAGNAAGH